MGSTFPDDGLFQAAVFSRRLAPIRGAITLGPRSSPLSVLAEKIFYWAVPVTRKFLQKEQELVLVSSPESLLQKLHSLARF